LGSNISFTALDFVWVFSWLDEAISELVVMVLEYVYRLGCGIGDDMCSKIEKETVRKWKVRVVLN
jgi:hypothetical protein